LGGSPREIFKGKWAHLRTLIKTALSRQNLIPINKPLMYSDLGWELEIFSKKWRKMGAF